MQTDMQTDRHADRQTDFQSGSKCCILKLKIGTPKNVNYQLDYFYILSVHHKEILKTVKEMEWHNF